MTKWILLVTVDVSFSISKGLKDTRIRIQIHIKRSAINVYLYSICKMSCFLYTHDLLYLSSIVNLQMLTNIYIQCPLSITITNVTTISTLSNDPSCDTLPCFMAHLFHLDCCCWGRPLLSPTADLHIYHSWALLNLYCSYITCGYVTWTDPFAKHLLIWRLAVLWIFLWINCFRWSYMMCCSFSY